MVVVVVEEAMTIGMMCKVEVEARIAALGSAEAAVGNSFRTWHAKPYSDEAIQKNGKSRIAQKTGSA